MLRLACSCKTNGWGRVGEQSEVAQLMAAGGDPDFELQPTQTYAELWMGTHTRGLCFIVGENGERWPFSEWLKANPEAMGKHVKNGLRARLPFLFKVLSVNRALSLQSHPTKDQAKLLHATDPEIYPDENHKPEMAIALTPFQMMCGFRIPQEIVANINVVPELAELIGADAVTALEPYNNDSDSDKDFKNLLKNAFSKLLKCDPETTKEAANKMVKRFSSPEYCLDIPEELRELVLRMSTSFPGDVGLFAPFFLNYFTLKPGEAVFLGPNEPHAYLLGNCIECMSSSDNTIRSGLTSKFKDMDNMCECLTYRVDTPTGYKLAPEVCSKYPYITYYKPHVGDFAVRKIEVNENGEYVMPALDSGSILLVIGGDAAISGDFRQLHRGVIAFVLAGHSQVLCVTKGPFEAYQAYCPGYD